MTGAAAPAGSSAPAGSPPAARGTSSAAAAPAIVVDGLRKAYAGREILGGITFDVRRGELFALLGPNGAGKTTTVEIIEGYRVPDGGTTRVLGLDPARDGRRLRPRIGLMLQDGGIDNRTTAREVLHLYARFYRDPEDPDRLLDAVDLGQAAGTRYRRLSGGEKQRLALALALLGRPELLVLDEPTAGMDPAAKQATRERIGDLRAAGTTILLTTHELGDVERLADRVAVLDHGRLVALGTPAELTGGGAPRLHLRLSRPLADGEASDLAAIVGGVTGGRPVVEASGGATAGAYDVTDLGRAPGPRLVAAVAAWCESRDLLVVELRTGAASLEERYLELVRDGQGSAAEGGR